MVDNVVDVGNVGEGTNWYTNDGFFNPNIVQGWDGVTTDTIGWINRTPYRWCGQDLDVVLRFVFLVTTCSVISKDLQLGYKHHRAAITVGLQKFNLLNLLVN